MNPAVPATPPAAPPVIPGNQTSEFNLTKLVAYVGLALTTIGTILATVQSILPAGNKLSVYVGVALAVVGALMKVAVVMGYQDARADTKVAAAQAAGATAAAQAQASAGSDARAGAEAAK